MALLSSIIFLMAFLAGLGLSYVYRWIDKKIDQRSKAEIQRIDSVIKQLEDDRAQWQIGNLQNIAKIAREEKINNLEGAIQRNINRIKRDAAYADSDTFHIECALIIGQLLRHYDKQNQPS